MRSLTAVVLAGVSLACLGAGAAGAQSIDSGTEVRVNPVAGGGGGMLLYPGGQYMRAVPTLLEPGETRGPVHLHMPRKVVHRTVVADAASTEAAPAAEEAAPKPKREASSEPVAPRHKREKVASAAPVEPAAAPPANSPGIYYGLGGNSAASLYGSTQSLAPPAEPARPAPPPRQEAAKPAKPAPAPKVQLAKAEPPPLATTTATGSEAGFTKRSVILFAPKASDPAESSLGAIKFLAGDLNTAMTSAASRIQIQAFGGARGDKSSDARRLSLKRALAIRQVLIDDGVPAERIDVRAMGGTDDSGPADRVDVYVKA